MDAWLQISVGTEVLRSAVRLTPPAVGTVALRSAVRVTPPAIGTVNDVRTSKSLGCGLTRTNVHTKLDGNQLLQYFIVERDEEAGTKT